MKKEYRVNKWWMAGLLTAFLWGCENLKVPEPAEDTNGIRLLTGNSLSAFDDGLLAFAAGKASGTYDEVWEAHGTAAGEAVLLQSHDYPSDGSRLYLRGYYPSAEPGSNGVVYRLDGSRDLLVSNEQYGSLADMFWQTGKRFTFRHLLTQLNIRVRVSEGYPADARLVRMQIGGSHPDVLLDLKKGTLLAMGEPAVLTVWESDGADVLLSDAYPDTPIATTMLEAAVPLTFYATVALSDGSSLAYEALPVRFGEAEGLAQAGTSYTLSVTLDAEKEKLSVATAVTGWTEKEGGVVEL